MNTGRCSGLHVLMLMARQIKKEVNLPSWDWINPSNGVLYSSKPFYRFR
jgi:hypothetical protein